MNYIAKFFDVNGICGYENLTARTLTGAKREATSLSAGTCTRISIVDEDGEPVAMRCSFDSFKGCCTGWQRWMDIPRR